MYSCPLRARREGCPRSADPGFGGRGQPRAGLRFHPFPPPRAARCGEATSRRDGKLEAWLLTHCTRHGVGHISWVALVAFGSHRMAGSCRCCWPTPTLTVRRRRGTTRNSPHAQLLEDTLVLMLSPARVTAGLLQLPRSYQQDAVSAISVMQERPWPSRQPRVTSPVPPRDQPASGRRDPGTAARRREASRDRRPGRRNRPGRAPGPPGARSSSGAR